MKYLIIILFLAACQVNNQQMPDSDTTPKPQLTGRKNDSFGIYFTGIAIRSPLDYFEIGEEFGRNRMERWEHYILYKPSKGYEKKVARCILSGDTLTITNDWPQIGTPVRLIKAFGKTYKIVEQ